jgi:hypothetical protein
MRWLVCLIGSTRVFVPTDAIKQISEYDVGPPPPLASPYLAGIGIVDNSLVLSIRVGLRPSARGRKTKGVLLATPASSLGWAFEVDQTIGLVTEVPSETLQSEPSWLKRTRTGERFLDVRTMVAAIEGA